MSIKQKIAIIGLDTLHREAIINIISQEYDNIIFNFDKTKDDYKKCFAFIISPETYIENLDFFLPIKGRTLIVTSRYESDKETECSSNFISTYSDFDMIRHKIFSLLSNIDKNVQSNNELTSREIDVLKEIASGKIIKEIADTLNISVNTVLTHRKNISSKLGIRSVSGLSLYAMMNGLLK